MLSFIFAVLLHRLWLRLRSRNQLWVTTQSLIVLAVLGFISNEAEAQFFRTPMDRQFAAPGMQRNGQRPVVTENFEVYAPDPRLANKVASEAERYRKELAIEWLGEPLPNWNQKCPIQVSIGPDAGGETSFAFIGDDRNPMAKGTPINWDMKIFGPPDRVLDAVLPHEITHTIFASHFGRPLPRWADEGACTTVEHESERAKNHRMLMSFLNSKPSRGIPFNRMFTMKRYPADILPLYAQGYSLAKFLIFQNGKKHFLNYISEGLNKENQMPAEAAWNRTTEEFYGYQDLSELQLTWIRWVREGSQQEFAVQLAKSNPNMVRTAANTQPARVAVPAARAEGEVRPIMTYASAPATTITNTLAKSQPSSPPDSWYVQQMRPRPASDASELSTGTMWR